VEVERKLLLADGDAWRTVVTRLRGVRLLHQHNRFLDDTARTWQAAALAVRVRDTDDTAWLTVKGPGEADGEFLRRAEWEATLTPAERTRLLHGSGDSGRWVADWMRARGAVPPPDAGAPLAEVAAFANLRALGWWIHDGNPWEIAADVSTYPDGGVMYELEMELHGKDPAAASRALSALLAATGVAATPSTVSKRHRLAEAMGEHDEGRP